jgi:hypothetical protein
MKIRTSFVSNSSSSSFICMVSGSVEGGYDISLREAGMCECVNGHIFCDQYRLVKPQTVQDLGIDEDDNYEDDNYEDDNYEDDNYNIPANQCPICTLKYITDADLLVYAIKKNNWDKKQIEANLRADYTDYRAFKEGMKI